MWKSLYFRINEVEVIIKEIKEENYIVEEGRKEGIKEKEK